MKSVWIHRILAVLNALLFSGAVALHYITLFIPIEGEIPAQIAGELPNFFVPSKFAFVAWIAISILQLGFIVYQLYKVFRSSETPLFFKKIWYFYTISCLLNAGWILAWHFDILWLSMILMVLLLAALTFIYVRLRAGLEDTTYRQQFMLVLPFSVTLAWMTIATVANVAAMLMKSGWNGWGISPEVWTIIAVIFCVLVTLWILGNRRDLGYAAVIEWSLFAMIFKQIKESGDGALSVVITAGAGMIAILVFSIIAMVRKSRMIS